MNIYELNVSGNTARDFNQARKHLTGDKSQQGEVSLYDGTKTIEAINAAPGNYPVCAYNGEMGSLLVTKNKAGQRSFDLR